MSWNKDCVFISKPSPLKESELLLKLGCEDYLPVGDVCLYKTIKFYLNDPAPLFIRKTQKYIMIIDCKLPFLFLEEPLSERAKTIIDAFPGSEIASLFENGTGYLFGYAVIQNGERVRLKVGDDGKIQQDFGEPLAEERAVLEEMQKSGDYQAIFGDCIEEGMSAAEAQRLVEFEASWRVPMQLSARYLGQPMDAFLDNELILTKYFKAREHN